MFIDDVIGYLIDPVNQILILQIFKIQLKSLRDAIDKQGIELDIDEETCRMLAHKGFTPKYGARQIAGMIRNYLRRPISRFVVSGEVKRGSKLMVRAKENEELVWSIQ